MRFVHLPITCDSTLTWLDLLICPILFTFIALSLFSNVMRRVLCNVVAVALTPTCSLRGPGGRKFTRSAYPNRQFQNSRTPLCTPLFCPVLFSVTCPTELTRDEAMSNTKARLPLAEVGRLVSGGAM